MKTRLIVAALLTTLSTQSYAEVYKCQVSGKTVFQDKPCDGFVVLPSGEMIPTKDYKAPLTPGEKLLIEQKEKAEADKAQLAEYRKARDIQEAKEKATAVTRANEVRWSTALSKNIHRDIVVIGMSKDDLFWSIGEPSKTNESVGVWGKHEQLIYRHSNIEYIYVENGKVTSWQAAY